MNKLITRFCRWWLQQELRDNQHLLDWWILWSDAKESKPPHTPTKRYIERLKDTGRWYDA